MLKRWVEPFTRSVGRLVDLPERYSQHQHKVKSRGFVRVRDGHPQPS